ncbi:D-galactose 1-dehydrogenase [Loktanella sp. PT4BL]|jgi:D-galactose 1-dehydrogenase|uniref:Gfo/Idh/MocA family protein n=1 Tax=Loktanella sp. PT4BL TaxID=2135611 RepID=UPI000D756C1E|nr:Gfo/Idh/MocA family oxidoreductase [Loktanella sp. PT4BL]PXW67546.1 D-galactose 1-dehydrogenase [Loktanella sp. PT4BL]
MTAICLVGIGKIAIDQHVPAIGGSDDWELAATVSRAGTVDGVQSFTDFDQMLSERPDIPVISLCLPPVPRYDYAAKAIAAGRHVMLEKPPGATLAEVYALADMARAAGVSLYTTWHSRMAKGVAPAKAWLADKTVTGAHICWKEDVRRWHPGQDWVFAPGGMGVFDPGSNALSIITEILPMPIHLRSAELFFPENRDTPIAAHMQWTQNVTGDFDWRQEGPQSWDITVETTTGTLSLHDGGARLLIDGNEVAAGADREYPALYDRMAELVKTNASEVDLSPMLHVADALTLGKRNVVAPFHF